MKNDQGGYRTRSRARNQEVKLRVFALYGNKCRKCNFADPRALQLDHVAGDGKHYGDGQRGMTLYYRILNGTYPQKDFQLLCANHNWIKRVENGEVPRAL